MNDRQPRDDGAILIIAIIVVTTVALVVGAVLTRGDGSVRATVQLRQVAGTTYAADGAAQVAIDDLRSGYNSGDAEPAGWVFNNASFTGCFGFNGDGTTVNGLHLPGFYPAPKSSGQGPTSAYVDCTAEAATGAQGSAVLLTNANRPGNAILTLGSGGENGFTFKTNGGSAFRVRGGVWSNSNIFRDTNGSLEASESIRAHSGCSPAAAMNAPVVDCGAGTVPDPNYPSEIDVAGTGVPALQTPPASCSGSVTLQPGYYDDASKLGALTPNGGSNCLIRLAPGTYYFDFHNSSSGYTMAGDAAHVWNVNSGTIVGGTLDPADTTVPGRCINPIENATPNQGVQLIFGGDSRIIVDKGAAMEVCGSYNSTRPPIAVYGQKTGTATETVVGGANALTTSGIPFVTPAGTDGTFVGATVASLQDAGGGSAIWSRPTANTNVSRMITMTGFAPSSAIPKGSVLTGAKVVVRHKSAQNNAGTASTITLTPAGAAALPSFDLQRPGTLTTQTVDLRTEQPAVFSGLHRQVHDTGYTGAKVDFIATIAKNLGVTATAELDAVRLELTYYLPALRGQTTTAIPGNTVATPGGEPVVKALGNTTQVYIQGTTYTPLSSLDLSLNNISESVFRFGVIARSLRVFETASFTYPGAVIELPDNSPGWGINGTIVQLKVYLCPAAPGCSASAGELALTSRVQLWDQTDPPTARQRQVSVMSWSHRR